MPTNTSANNAHRASIFPHHANVRANHSRVTMRMHKRHMPTKTRVRCVITLQTELSSAHELKTRGNINTLPMHYLSCVLTFSLAILMFVLTLGFDGVDRLIERLASTMTARAAHALDAMKNLCSWPNCHAHGMHFAAS